MNETSAASGAGDAPAPDAICDGGDLDCGSGLLLIIRQAMQPLQPGGILEVRSRESSVGEDLPAWCRMVGHHLMAQLPFDARTTRYLVVKQGATADVAPDDPLAFAADLEQARRHTWQARVRWQHGMQATALVRNHAVVVGQPASFDTADAAPSAIELLLASLGGCLAVAFQWRASRVGIEVSDLEITLSAKADDVLVFLGIENDGNPGLASVSGTAYVRALAGETDRLADLWEETLRRSPVFQSLARPVAVDVDLRVL